MLEQPVDSFSGLGQSFRDMPSALSKGVGSLVNDPYGTAKGLFKSQSPDDYAQDAQGNYFNKITGEVGLPTVLQILHKCYLVLDPVFRA